MDLDPKVIEEVINQIYSGMTMFVRDVNLSNEIANKYTEGLIIREKAFTDASGRVMGMITTHRFAILSNHMDDLREFEHGTNWGLCVANKDSHFKVLTIHKYNGKTMILLLHLPDDESWKMFWNVEINLDFDIIKTSIERFENKCDMAAVSELTTDEWLQRCAFPIGLDDEGDFFELD